MNDAVGNPTTFKGLAQTFNAVNQNTQGATLGFDGDGNPQGVNGTALSWDANNKLAGCGAVLSAACDAVPASASAKTAKIMRTRLRV